MGRAPVITWENLDFYETNVQILKRNNGSWRHPPKEIKIGHTLSNMMLKTLDKSKHEGVNLWKDPRFCLTCEHWRDLMFERKERMKVVVVVRNPLDCVRSLRRLYKVEMNEGLRLYEQYHLSLMKCVGKLPYVTTVFEGIMTDPRKALRPVIKFIGEGPLGIDYDLVKPKNWRHAGAEHDGEYSMQVPA